MFLQRCVEDVLLDRVGIFYSSLELFVTNAFVYYHSTQKGSQRPMQRNKEETFGLIPAKRENLRLDFLVNPVHQATESLHYFCLNVHVLISINQEFARFRTYYLLILNLDCSYDNFLVKVHLRRLLENIIQAEGGKET